jgi:hypothetical protein
MKRGVGFWPIPSQRAVTLSPQTKSNSLGFPQIYVSPLILEINLRLFQWCLREIFQREFSPFCPRAGKRLASRAAGHSHR